MIRVEEADELDAMSASIVRKEALGGVSMCAFAIGLTGMAGCVWFTFGLPGPELDHGWVRDQATLHGPLVAAIALASLIPAVAGGWASMRIMRELDRLYRTQAFLQEVVRSRLLPVGRRGVVRDRSRRPSEAMVQYIDDRQGLLEIQQRINDLYSQDDLPLDVDRGADTGAESSAGAPAAMEPAIEPGGGDFGGGGATGDFSSND